MVGPGDRVEAPCEFSGLLLIRVDEPADPVFPTGDPRQDLVPHDEWRAGHAVAGRFVGDFHVPEHSAGLRIESEEVGVERDHVQPGTQDGYAPVIPPAAEIQILGHLVVVAPILTAGSRIERNDVARRFGHVHDTVYDEGRRLGSIQCLQLESPLHLEPPGVPFVDLAQPAVALTVVVARVHEPVLRLRVGIQQALLGHRIERRSGGIRLRPGLLLRSRRRDRE